MTNDERNSTEIPYFIRSCFNVFYSLLNNIISRQCFDFYYTWLVLIGPKNKQEKVVYFVNFSFKQKSLLSRNNKSLNYYFDINCLRWRHIFDISLHYTDHETWNILCQKLCKHMWHLLSLRRRPGGQQINHQTALNFNIWYLFFFKLTFNL